MDKPQFSMDFETRAAESSTIEPLWQWEVFNPWFSLTASQFPLTGSAIRQQLCACRHFTTLVSISVSISINVSGERRIHWSAPHYHDGDPSSNTEKSSLGPSLFSSTLYSSLLLWHISLITRWNLSNNNLEIFLHASYCMKIKHFNLMEQLLIVPAIHQTSPPPLRI